MFCWVLTVRVLKSGLRDWDVRKLKISETPSVISASLVTAGTAKVKVPMLVLRGEWLKAVGFPIGAAAYLTTDRRGELTLHRLGLSFPRRVRILAANR